MIKIDRGKCPKELTGEVKEELTNIYKADSKKDVWNSPKIKEPLRKALLDMSYGKCAYCECKIGIESKDMTVDHFLPKSMYEDLVVEWTNLIPSCLRCNQSKNDETDTIVDPCNDDPKMYLGFRKSNSYRMVGIDTEGIGKNTIDILELNNVERVMVPRITICEKIYDQLRSKLDYLQEHGETAKCLRKIRQIMNQCTKESEYAATVATHILNSDVYKRIKEILKANGSWSYVYQEIEEEMEGIAFQYVDK